MRRAGNLDDLVTNDSFMLGTFTHYNFPVNSGTAITGATLSVNFTVLINGTPHVVGPILINFDHNETTNNGTPEQNRDIITINTTTTTVTILGQEYFLEVFGLRAGRRQPGFSDLHRRKRHQ